MFYCFDLWTRPNETFPHDLEEAKTSEDNA